MHLAIRRHDMTNALDAAQRTIGSVDLGDRPADALSAVRSGLPKGLGRRSAPSRWPLVGVVVLTFGLLGVAWIYLIPAAWLYLVPTLRPDALDADDADPDTVDGRPGTDSPHTKEVPHGAHEDPS
jgi:hypothetical protein